MKCILNFTKKELENEISPKFRAKQIYEWIYKKYINDFALMTNLPKTMQEHLKQNFYINPLKLVKEEISLDKSKKYLFALKDNNTIEAVLLLMQENENKENKYTICISSQVGCRMGCKFCFTAKSGLLRNLTAGEIVAQVLEIKKLNNIPSNISVNIVFMGMGEPLDNLENVIKAVRIFSDNDGLSISTKRQTISTSGLSKKIDILAKEDLGILLAISLHATDDETRDKLMPINKAYNINSILESVRNFPINIRKKVMFEYLMIKNLNDDLKSAKNLVKLLHGIKAKVNLIYFNPHEGSIFQRPSKEKMQEFSKYLNNHGLISTIRISKGIDISAACGQLKERNENVNN